MPLSGKLHNVINKTMKNAKKDGLDGLPCPMCQSTPAQGYTTYSKLSHCYLFNCPNCGYTNFLKNYRPNLRVYANK